ncbi:hypothetical protein [Amycolatopsis sp. NPDC098790]|uniref:hypothetical protein n=1 Tax=Amycolatopsis sp. NPDC098790 TaxID=3363939 RepID=UPI00381BF568
MVRRFLAYLNPKPRRRSHYLLDETRREIASRREKRPWRRRLYLNVERHPILPALVAHILIAVIAVLFVSLSPSFLPNLLPPDPRNVLLVLWQVHVTFVSIAYAGLALIFQLATGPVVTARSLRAIIFQNTYFVPILFYALIGTMQLGAITFWAVSGSAILLEFILTFGLAVTGVAFAYSRTARIFRSSRYAFDLGKSGLIDRALDSLYDDRTLAEANRRLATQIPRIYRTFSDEEAKKPQEIVVRAKRSGTVGDLDMRLLREFLEDLEGAATNNADQTQETSKDFSFSEPANIPTLHTLFSLGQRVDVGDPLFLVQKSNPNVIKLNASDKLAEIIVWERNSSRHHELFRDEISALRDNLIAAINRQALGDLLDGLLVYTELAKEVHEQSLKISQHDSIAPESLALTSWLAARGREWEILTNDMHDVVSKISDLRDDRTWIEVVKWIFEITNDFTSADKVENLPSILNLVLAAWTGVINAQEPSPSRQQAILMRLKEVPLRAKARKQSDAGIVKNQAVAIARTFTAAIKHCIDRKQSDAAALSIEYFIASSDYADSDESVLARTRNAAFLALDAWLLYKADKLSNGLDKMVHNSLQAHLREDQNLWESVKIALDGSHQDSIGWSWWELDTLHPINFGSQQLDTYILYSAIIAQAHSPLIIPESLDDDEAYLTRRFVDSIRSLIGSDIEARKLDPRSDEQLEEAALRLQEKVDNFEHQREVIEAALPLDKERIARFRTKFSHELAVLEGRLISIFPNSEDVEFDNDIAFGVNKAYPKWYFADTHVSAQPEGLAADLVRSLSRGEEAHLVESALAAVEENFQQSSTDDLLQNFKKWTKGHAGDILVLTNSHQALHAFDELVLSNNNGLLSIGPNAFLKRVYDDRDPYVLAFTYPQGISIARAAPEMLYDGDEVDSDLNILIGVRAFTDTEVEEASGGDEDSALKLRSSAVVRVLEKLKIQIRDESNISAWKLPNDIW